VTDHTVRQLVVNCTRLKSLSVANCTLLSDNSLLDIAAHAPTLRHYTRLSLCVSLSVWTSVSLSLCMSTGAGDKWRSLVSISKL